MRWCFYIVNSYSNLSRYNLTLIRRKHRPKLPVVLTRAEVGALLRWIDPKYKLVAQLLYGSGLRLMEAVRLRVKDIDFDYLSVMVWQGKGNKNRRVTLASELVPALRQQIIHVERLLDADVQNPVYSGVWLPYALALKNPAAPKQLGLALLVSIESAQPGPGIGAYPPSPSGRDLRAQSD